MLMPIGRNRLPEALDLLCEGFPERSRDFWKQALDRLADHAGNQTLQFPLGFFWMEKDVPAGIALTPASPRAKACGAMAALVNISSWYMRPEARWKAPLMLRALFKTPDAIFTDLTPTPEVQKMLPAFGFRPVNAGTVIHPLPWLALKRGSNARIRPWRAGEVLPPGSPPVDVIEQHRRDGCLPLMIGTDSGPVLVVARPSRFRGLKSASLVYIGSHRTLDTALPALARFLLVRGYLIAQSDVRVARAGPGFRPRGVWFALGGAFDDCTDHLGSELCLLDF
jgi:hypothetical protein